MPAVKKEILKPKVVIILTIAKLLFANSIRAEHSKAGQKRKYSTDYF